MLHGDMRTYSNGRKKSYNAWGKTSAKTKLEKDLNTSNSTYSWQPNVRRRSSSEAIKSVHTSTPGTCSKPEQKVYTGTLIKGISQTHKSNAVPVISREEIIDIGKMRR